MSQIPDMHRRVVGKELCLTLSHAAEVSVQGLGGVHEKCTGPCLRAAHRRLGIQPNKIK